MTLLIYGVMQYGVVGLLALVSYVIGRRLTLRLSYHSAWEQLACCTTVGLGVLAYLVFGLGLLGWLYRGVVLLVLAVLQVPCLSVWRALIDQARALPSAVRRWPASTCGAIVLVLGWGPVWLQPLYPPTAWDATECHLAYAKVFLQHHRVIFTPFLRHEVFPQLQEMLFTLMMLLFTDIAAQLVQFLMFALMAIALYAWGRRLGTPRIGWWAAALWCSHPLVVWLASAAMVDVGVALFVGMGACALWVWAASQQRPWLILAGVLGGCAAGSKYHGLFGIGGFGLVVLWYSLRRGRWADVALFLGVACAVAAPWYLRNVYYTGNPLFPFFARYFGSGPWSAEEAGRYEAQLLHQGPGKTIAFFLHGWWNLAVHQRWFDGAQHLAPCALSAVPFLALPVLFLRALTERPLRLPLVLVCAYLAGWFATAQDLRFLVPALPLLGLATASALDGIVRMIPLKSGMRRDAFITACGCALLLIPTARYTGRVLKQWGLPPVTAQQRERYLSQTVPLYPLIARLNALKGRQYTVYVLYQENLAYFADGLFLGSFFGPARYGLIEGKLHRGDGGVLYQQLRVLGAGYFVLPRTCGLWHLQLPGDASFQEHFKLIEARPDGWLFELMPGPRRPVSG